MKQDARSTTDALTRAVDALPGVHTAILYGSILDGRFGEHSDVDLAVAGDAELTYDELVEMSETLGRLVGREVQIRDLRRLQGLILREVLTQGTTLRGDDSEFLGRRIADMLDFTEDWLPAVQLINSAAIQRMTGDA